MDTENDQPGDLEPVDRPNQRKRPSATPAGYGSSHSVTPTNDHRFDGDGGLELAVKILDTVREPMLVLDPSLVVLRANTSFYEHFDVDPEATLGRRIFELGEGEWDNAELRKLLEQVLPQNEYFNDFLIRFERLGPRTMLLNARRIDAIDLILLAFEDVTERNRLEFALRDQNRKLQREVDYQVQALKLLQDITRISNEATSVEQGLRAALARICEYNGWQAGHVWWFVGDDEAGRLLSTDIWHFSDEQRFGKLREATRGVQLAPGEELAGRVLQEGRPIWVEDIREVDDWLRGDPGQLMARSCAALPVTIGDRPDTVLEFYSAEPVEREENFVAVMPEIGIQIGHLIARKRLEKEVADQMDRDQQRFGQELHDGLGQLLSGLGLLAANLRKDVETAGSPHLKAVDRLTGVLDDARSQARALTLGILPVNIDAGGLRSAVQALVEQTREGFHIDCTFACDEAIRLDNSFAANHLYRIIQEAIHNAVKHAEAKRIDVRIKKRGAEIHVEVQDDGVGMDLQRRRSLGSGVRIMRYRAGLIGAILDLQSKPGAGTFVACTLPPQKDPE